MQYYLFTVDEKSWSEHRSTGIAAINDPGHNPLNRQGNAQRQAAMCELAGIKKGDLLFFYLQQKKQIMGLYEAKSKPFYDTGQLVKNGFIDNKFPFRIEFKQKVDFQNNLDMDEIWRLKDKGNFWSIQQQRGSTVGRHACISLMKKDGAQILKMLYQKNPVLNKPIQITIPKHNNANLPFDLRNSRNKLHYEAVLQALLIKNIRSGKHKNIFGKYKYVVNYMPTSYQTEIDILLNNYTDDNEIIWYQILELKKEKFTVTELNVLMKYEDWAINALANDNARLVHSVGIANSFSDEVLEYIKNRTIYGGKKIKLVKYTYNNTHNSINLREIN
ncbi:EVE domain-containing protein [bacterium]|nr:EVE domain-containing protein [bacterium]